MLELTTRAVVVLADMRQKQQIPDHFGLRVALGSTEDEDGQFALRLSWAEVPAAADEVSEHGGVRLFVASELAQPLADKSLDVDMKAPASETRLRLCEADET